MASSPVPLFHRDYGGDGLPPLVILHGMLGSSRNWQTAGQDLAARYHVLAPDLRNHGQSPHAEPMDYAAMAADVGAWLDAAGLGAVTLLGHSMGGKVAMRLACREPRRVDRLVIVDISPKHYRWEANRDIYAAMNELDLSTLASRAEAEKRMESRVKSWAMRQFLLTNLRRDSAGRWTWIVNLPVLAAAIDTLETNPLEPGDRFEGPTLVVVGGKSGYFKPGDEAAIRAHFPAARIEVLAAAGHNPHMETRAEFVRAVLG